MVAIANTHFLPKIIIFDQGRIMKAPIKSVRKGATVNDHDSSAQNSYCLSTSSLLLNASFTLLAIMF